MPRPDWAGTCPDCGGDLYDPEPWHAHDLPMLCDTCEHGQESAADRRDRLCPHGLFGPCPDCRPDTITVDDSLVGAPTARVRPKRDWPWVVVERFRPNGSLDWYTYHLTRRAARRAVRLYERTGKVVGVRP